MTGEDLILHLFCMVNDAMKDITKHPQARLHPSELVTIGLLFALKGAPFRTFYRWLKREYHHLFPRLPERTRLQRALAPHRGWCARFLASPTFFTTINTFGIELIHPVREGRSPRQVGRKGKSNYRWIVGIKLCWLINQQGQVVAWAWKTANVHDQAFRSLARTAPDRDGVQSPGTYTPPQKNLPPPEPIHRSPIGLCSRSVQQPATAERRSTLTG